MADKIKLLLAVLVVIAGIAAYYYFPQYSAPVRVLGLLLVAAIAIAIAMQSQTGRSAWEFLLEARNEVRKVVWPTRKETTQTTIIVFVVVIVVSIILWLLDTFLLWAVRFVTG